MTSKQLCCRCAETSLVTCPSCFPKQVETLTLIDRNLTELPFSSQFTCLRYINLSSNNIVDVDRKQLEGSSKVLRCLDLSRNHLITARTLTCTTTASSSSSHLTSLRILRLSHNQLKSIKDVSWECLPVLSELWLSYNKLHNIHACSRSLSQCPRLQHLIIEEGNPWEGGTKSSSSSSSSSLVEERRNVMLAAISSIVTLDGKVVDGNNNNYYYKNKKKSKKDDGGKRAKQSTAVRRRSSSSTMRRLKPKKIRRPLSSRRMFGRLPLSQIVNNNRDSTDGIRNSSRSSSGGGSSSGKVSKPRPPVGKQHNRDGKTDTTKKRGCKGIRRTKPSSEQSLVVSKKEEEEKINNIPSHSSSCDEQKDGAKKNKKASTKKGRSSMSISEAVAAITAWNRTQTLANLSSVDIE